MITFTPSVNPSQGSGIDYEANVTEVVLGDGYVQRVSLGLNEVSSKLKLNWNKSPLALRTELHTFFSTCKGSIPFLYTFPGESAKAYVCKKWSKVSGEAALMDFNAELTETFDYS